MWDIVLRRVLLWRLKNYVYLRFPFNPSDFEHRFDGNVTSMILDALDHSHKGGIILFLIFGGNLVILGFLGLWGARWGM